jgi:hypothetical protein
MPHLQRRVACEHLKFGDSELARDGPNLQGTQATQGNTHIGIGRARLVEHSLYAAAVLVEQHPSNEVLETENFFA